MINERGGPSEQEMGIETEKRRNLEVTQETEGGLWLRRVEKDERGRAAYEEVRRFMGESSKEGDREESHYEKQYEFDGDSERVARERGRDFKPKEGASEPNVWDKSFKHDSQGRIIEEVGEKTAGLRRGRKWKKTYEYDTVSGRLLEEENRIIEAGEGASDKGRTIRKDHRSSY